MNPPLAVRDVFQPGGINLSYTYVKRRDAEVENRIVRYLEYEPNTVLIITGPSRTGKTTLVRAHTRNHSTLFINAGRIDKEEELWSNLLSQLGGYSVVEQQVELQETQTTGSGAAFNLGVVAKLESKASQQKHFGQAERSVHKREVSVKQAALTALEESETKPILVFDDFHRLPQAIVPPLILAFKSLLEYNVRIIVVAIPQKAGELVKQNREMLGRVVYQSIPLWSLSELVEIPKLGFDSLNVILENEDQVFDKIARESYGSPFIAQKICLRVCEQYSIRGNVRYERPIRVQLDSIFFSSLFNGDLDTQGIFKKLTKTRRGLKPRMLNTGQEKTIYELLFSAIVNASNVSKVTLEEAVAYCQKVCTLGNAPSPQEVGSFFNNLSKRARKLQSATESREEAQALDPIIEYQDETLYITEPFFVYFLKWKSGLVD